MATEAPGDLYPERHEREVKAKVKIVAKRQNVRAHQRNGKERAVGIAGPASSFLLVLLVPAHRRYHEDHKNDCYDAEESGPNEGAGVAGGG